MIGKVNGHVRSTMNLGNRLSKDKAIDVIKGAFRPLGSQTEVVTRIKNLGPQIMETAFPNISVEDLVAKPFKYFDDEFIQELKEKYKIQSTK